MSARGFSLAEVLASLCVLSLLASAVMPLVAECRRLEERSSNRALVELSLSADQVCADSSAYGIDTLAVGERRLVTSPEGQALVVERLLLDSSDASRQDWLRIADPDDPGGNEVLRFVPYVEQQR